tara:strand:+ start:333 stop:527 length:195 start_codon:yes stop_codon:yes gene_type:complete
MKSNNIKCTICECMFSLEAEGGTSGDLGQIPVNFCVTCLSSIYDMCESIQLRDVLEKTDEKSSV